MTTRPASTEKQPEKEAYTPPQLTRHGTVEELTAALPGDGQGGSGIPA
jgi:hypothetical protein